MANNVVGSASISLRADTKQLASDLNSAESTTKSKLSTMASYAAKSASLAAVAITTAATTAVAGIISKSSELYSSFEQSVGGTETLFKDASDEVLKNADNAFKTAAISADQYLQNVNSFAGALMQSTGENAKEAAELADLAMQSMADNSAKIGTDITMLQNAYQSLARGQFMLLDNLKLGYGGTRSEMERLIKDASGMTDEMNKLGVTVDATSMDFGNMIKAIAVVQEHMGIAGTTINEAYSTIEGSQKMLKAATSDFLRGLADPTADLGQLFDNLTDSALAFGKNIFEMLKRLLPNISTAVKKLGDFLGENLPGIIQDVVPILIETIIDVADSLISYAPQIVDALIKASTQIIISLAQKLPEILSTVVTAILGIVNVLLQPENLLLIQQAFFELLLGIVRAIPQIIVAFNEAMPTLLDTVIQMLTSPEYFEMLFKAAVLLFMAIVEALPQILGSLIEAWKKIFGKLWEITKGLFQDFAANFGKGISNAIIGGLNKMLDFVQNTINAPINAINGALDAINQIPGVSIQHINQLQLARIPMLASGGLITGPTTALIGEAGPEAVIPLQNTNSWAKALASAITDEFSSDGFSGGQTVNVYVQNTINSKLDIEEVSRELVTQIRRAI